MRIGRWGAEEGKFEILMMDSLDYEVEGSGDGTGWNVLWSGGETPGVDDGRMIIWQML
jgi:hypothetical protein